jgi:signal transduction histidine kinase/CheY-like chemotaxis protein
MLKRIEITLNEQGINAANADPDESMNLLRPVAYFLAVVYFLLTFSHYFLLQETFKWILIASTLFTAIVCIATGLNAPKLASTRRSLIILLMMLLASSNSLLHLWFSEAPEQSTNIFLTIIASGVVLSNRTLWTISILFNWIGWTIINISLDILLVQHFFFAMAMSTLLSWFAHIARQKLIKKHVELKRERDLATKHEQVAKAATESKSLFLANMSHEIRTPMNGVIGTIELMSHSKLDSEQKGFIATAKRSAQSLMMIINDILDFSKIEAGQLKIELVEFDLQQHLVELTHDMQFQANAKELKLKLLTNKTQQTKVLGDPYRIAQIMNNLLSNAIKFTQSGSITVEYDLTVLNENILLSVVVTDTGIGISADALPHLFDSFSQADMSTTRSFGGTGLGLAITQHLCKIMRGEIKVKSKLGEGSAFQFSVMLATPSQAATEEETPSNKQSIPNFSNMKVLLVEDNDINQEVMFAILKGLKINVHVVNNGLEAIAILTNSHSVKFDLILMDCQMPEMDGYEATRRIRAGEAGEVFSKIPISALTANNMKDERQKCLAVGMNEYLTKPIDIKALKLMLAKYEPTLTSPN